MIQLLRSVLTCFPELAVPLGDSLQPVDDIQMLRAGHFTPPALDTVFGVGLQIDKKAVQFLKMQLFGHLLIGFAGQQLVIVVLHKRCDRNILRTGVHAVLAARAQAIHIFRDMLLNPLPIGRGKRPCIVGRPTGRIDMLPGRKPIQSNRNLWTTDAESQRCFGWCLALAGQKGQFL